MKNEAKRTQIGAVLAAAIGARLIVEISTSVSCLAGRNVRSGCRPFGATRRNHTPVIRFLQPARLFLKTAPAP